MPIPVQIEKGNLCIKAMAMRTENMFSQMQERSAGIDGFRRSVRSLSRGTKSKKY